MPSKDEYKITLLSKKKPDTWEEDVVDNSSPSLGTQEIAGGPPEVPLGADQFFGDMETGDSWGNWSGDVIGNAGSGTDLNADRAEAAALAVSGLGEIDQYAWVGIPFTVTGDGSQSADVTISGNWQGRVLTTPSGTIELTIKAFVENKTTGAVWESQIHQNSGSFIDGYVYNMPSYSETLTPELEAGNTYRAYAQIHAHASVSGLADASCDFGPGDGDNGTPKQGLYVDDVEIEF